jgi:glutathione S-transferase
MTRPTLVIGNKNYSSWSLRPWMGLVHTGIAFDEVLLPLDTEEFARRIGDYSAAGKVPVLIDGDLTVWDSLAILEYLAESHAQLWPDDAGERAVARAISAEMHSGFSAMRSAMPMNIRATSRHVDIDDRIRADIVRIEAIWHSCRSQHQARGPYLFGRFTVADAMYAPVASRFRTYGITLGPLAQDYVETVHADPAFKAWREAALKETWVVEADEAGS